MNSIKNERISEILAQVRPLAAEFYKLTGKPLGVTGEIAEWLVADALGLELEPARTAGYDAIRRTSTGIQRIQIKARAFAASADKGQRIGSIKPGSECDAVLLVILDNDSLHIRELWEAPISKIEALLTKTNSKARQRGALAVSEFKKHATEIKLS